MLEFVFSAQSIGNHSRGVYQNLSMVRLFFKFLERLQITNLFRNVFLKVIVDLFHYFLDLDYHNSNPQVVFWNQLNPHCSMNASCHSMSTIPNRW